MYVYIYMYVCMYVCMYYVWMDICMYGWMYGCMDVWMYACMDAGCMHARMHLCMHLLIMYNVPMMPMCIYTQTEIDTAVDIDMFVDKRLCIRYFAVDYVDIYVKNLNKKMQIQK